MIVGIGTDIIAIERIRRAEEKSGGRFSQRVLTAAEKRIYEGRRDRMAVLAARFAAKEAVAKALGTGLGLVSWQDIEIGRSETGRPVVRLTGEAEQQARRLGIGEIQLSLSHCQDYAVAFALALRKPGGE
ncbi:MAG: holo-ACP synthase [Bacillota bacterium]